MPLSCSLVASALLVAIVDAPSVLGRSGTDGALVDAVVAVAGDAAAVEIAAAELESDAPALSHGFGGDGITAIESCRES